MNYLGLISLCLGIVAVLLSIQYMNSTDKLLNEIRNIRTKCLMIKKQKAENKITELLMSLKRDSGLSLPNIKKMLLKSTRSGFCNVNM